MAKNLDEIINMIKNLDLQDDGICMNRKIKSIELDFCNIVKDEQMLSDSMDYINQKVLEDCDAALKFAMLFSSRNFDSLAMHDTKVRCKMLNILQKNFANAETFQKENKNLLYNSVTLLGEYYHRVRLADGSPIDILGESLLQLLIQAVEFDNSSNTEGFTYPNIDHKLSKLILSQVTLNGSILRSNANHKDELNKLLYYVRKNLIEQPSMATTSKALLLMTLDLYYNNFNSLTKALEEMYTKYLIEEDKQEQQTAEIENKSVPESPTTNKKWSEQVCEDSMYEFELAEAAETTSNNNSLCDSPNNVNSQAEIQFQSLPPRPTRYDEDDNGFKPPPRRDYFPRRSNKNRSMSPQSSSLSNQQGSIQQRLYNNTSNDKYVNRNNRNPNRYSANFDDDRNSVRSEGGSIKLYNAGDNRNSSRATGNEFEHSNWDRNTDQNSWDRGSGYHTYDGRRRSTSRNNNQRDTSYNNNNSNNNSRNRNTYDRPPRFRNLESQSWRNGPQDNKYNRSNSKGADSRSSSINRTFPRSNRQGSYDPYNGDNFRESKNNLQEGQSPENIRYGNNSGNGSANYDSRQANEKTNGPDLSANQRPQQSRNFGRSNNDRYGSHYSLSSADGGTWQRRGRQKTRNSYRRASQDWGDTRSLHENDINSENKWDDSKGDNELVKNARNTTKYMQYLSRKN